MAEPSGMRVHATAVVVGEAGILIRGASGSGKTSLALALIAQAATPTCSARLVGDDRIALSAKGERLLAAPVPPLEGLVERRGLGLTPQAHLPRVVVRLLVDCLGEEPVRMPEPEALVDSVLGIALPRLSVAGGAADAPTVLAALHLFLDRG